MYTLKSDHGKFVSAEDGGAPQGTIDGRPAGLMTANRDVAGGWESFMVFDSDDEGHYSIQSTHGFYACCEEEGKAGYIAFRSTEVGAWEKFILHLQDNGKKASFESACRPGYFIKVWPDGRVSLDQPMFDGQPVAEPGGYETFIIDPPFSHGVVPGESIIQGQLRIDGNGFYDDSGARILPIGLHVGDLFSKFVRDPAHSERIISQARDAGYSYIHFWMNLGTLGDYWKGRECGPGYTEDFWGQLGKLGDVLDKYGMKGGYNLGDYELWPNESHSAFFEELGRHLAQRENCTAAYVFGGNEAWQTGADNKQEIEHALQEFKACCPSVIVTTTAPPSEHENDIAEWCGGDFFAIHGYRGGEDHDRIRHIFSVQWEGHPPKKYGIQDEWTGPGDEVSVKPSHCYEGRDVDCNHMIAGAVQSLMCNQAFNYFCGDGVKSDGDITRWPGYHEVPRVAQWMPKDIMAWPSAIHFGTTQPDRIFEPTAADTLRFDHRIRGNEFFGVFYGDEGDLRARCKRACFLSVIGFDGVVGPEHQFDLGQEVTLHFVRSQGGQPGNTAAFVIGRLR